MCKGKEMQRNSIAPLYPGSISKSWYQPPHSWWRFNGLEGFCNRSIWDATPNLKIHMQTTIQTEADQCGERGTQTVVPLHSACLLSDHDRRSPRILLTAHWDFTHTWALVEVRHTLQTAVCALTTDWTCGFLPSGGDYICAHNWGDNYQYAASSM